MESDGLYSLYTLTNVKGEEEIKRWFSRGVQEEKAALWGVYYLEDNPDAIVMLVGEE